MLSDEIKDIFKIEVITEANYRNALTHPSYTKDNNLNYTECYERLEFLGDAVLKLAVSNILYKEYPDYTEGQISTAQMKSICLTIIRNIFNGTANALSIGLQI